MRLVRLSEAARLLGVDADTLRRRAAKTGDSLEIYGFRLRVYRMDVRPDAERRLDADEIRRGLARLGRGQ
jgi:CO/xanthine dehydrogenase Mo-binding subunit